MVSPAGMGPRAGQPVVELDAYDNLLLLCPNDHRLIDGLVAEYPVERLREIKRSHEDWVKTALQRSNGLASIAIVRGEPKALRYLGTARDLLAVAASAEESSLDYEEVTSELEVTPFGEYRTAFWAAPSDPCLWVADHCSWAIQRKWERADARSYDLIKDKIKSEFDIFRRSRTTYY